MYRHLAIFFLAGVLVGTAVPLFIQRRHASAHALPSVGTTAWRLNERGAPAPAIEPYVRPEFAAQMRALRPAIIAAAQRHNQPTLSGMTDQEFAVIMAALLYNEHFGWFEERVPPVQWFTPLYERLQRTANQSGLSNLTVWPANLRPSVGLEIVRGELPLPHSSASIGVPVRVAGSRIDPAAYDSQAALAAAIADEIADPELAVEYLAANLARGVYRARIERVSVTWRALAAWHNQGIVAPAALRANPTASDYVRRASAYFGRAYALIEG